MVSHQHVETRHYWPSPPQDYTHAAMLQPPSCGCSRLNDRIRRSRAATRLDSRKVYRCLPQRPFGRSKMGKCETRRGAVGILTALAVETSSSSSVENSNIADQQLKRTQKQSQPISPTNEPFKSGRYASIKANIQDEVQCIWKPMRRWNWMLQPLISTSCVYTHNPS